MQQTWTEPFGEYFEMRKLAAVLCAIADENGQTLHALAATMPYCRATISANLTGCRRPDWDFVIALLKTCTGRDQYTMQVLVRRVRSLWEAAEPARARRVAAASPPEQEAFSAVLSETRAWVAAIHEIVASQHMHAWGELSVTRHSDVATLLATMLERLTDAVNILSAEEDALLRESTTSSIPGDRLRAGARLQDVQRRLAVAEDLYQETARRLYETLRQRREAERLQQAALSRLDRARRLFVDFDDPTATAIAQTQLTPTRDHEATEETMSPADQQLAFDILRHVDEVLQQEAAGLDLLGAGLPTFQAGWTDIRTRVHALPGRPGLPTPLDPSGGEGKTGGFELELQALIRNHPRDEYGSWTR